MSCSLTPAWSATVDVPSIVTVAVPVDETTASDETSTPSPAEPTPVIEMLPLAEVTVVSVPVISTPSSPVAVVVVPLSVIIPEVV